MDLVARLHRFLFQIKEDLRKPRLFFGQREDGLVDDLETQRRLHALAPAVRDAEPDASFPAWLVYRRVQRGFDPKLIGRLQKDEPVIAGQTRVATEQVGLQVNRPCQFWRGCNIELRLAVYD